MKKDEWFRVWFNSPYYLNLYKHRNNSDAKKIVNLLLNNFSFPQSSSLLDLACGNGRHSILFAKKGFNVTGIDLSEYLISSAKKKQRILSSKINSKLRFEIRDMRKLNYTNEFDIIVNLFTSFGYFKNDYENLMVLKSISRSLKIDGYFFLDFINKFYLSKYLEPFSVRADNLYIFIEQRKISSEFIEKKINIIDKKSYSATEFTERIKLYLLNDFIKMFSVTHLKILKVFGDYSGKLFNKFNSPRLIIIAQKY